MSGLGIRVLRIQVKQWFYVRHFIPTFFRFFPEVCGSAATWKFPVRRAGVGFVQEVDQPLDGVPRRPGALRASELAIEAEACSQSVGGHPLVVDLGLKVKQSKG